MEFSLQAFLVEYWTSKDGTHNVRAMSDAGEFQFRSREVDLSKLPRMIPVTLTGKLKGRVWRSDSGPSQTLEITDLKYKLVSVAPAAAS